MASALKNSWLPSVKFVICSTIPDMQTAYCKMWEITIYLELYTSNLKYMYSLQLTNASINILGAIQKEEGVEKVMIGAI